MSGSQNSIKIKPCYRAASTAKDISVVQYQCLAKFSLFSMFKIKYKKDSAVVFPHSVYGNVITYLCLLFPFLFILAHGSSGAWKTYISLQEATFDILRIEHQRYKAVLYYISQWEKSPENLHKLQLSIRESSINTVKELGAQFYLTQHNCADLFPSQRSIVRVFMNE